MSKQNLLGKESLAEKMQKIRSEMTLSENTGVEKDVNDKQQVGRVKELKKTVKINPKLFVSGRLDRKKYSFTPKSLTLLTHLEEEIKIYCRGGDLVVLNYLIKEGLEKVKASKDVVNIDMEEMLSDII